jgi:uncharacterized membrane protein YedE/YeeE
MKLAPLAVGAVFGFVLAAANLSSYEVIHNMLLLREFDVFFLMGSAIGVAAPVLWFMERRRWRTPSGAPLVVQREPVRRGTFVGAAVFGAGWAVAGTCPGPALVMTVGGTLLGTVIMAGLAAGALLRDRVAGPEEGAAHGAPSTRPVEPVGV